MTENEAISRIKDHMEIHRLKEPRAIYITVALSMAISALQEIRRYREIGTVEECRKAVEKQKLKTPGRTGMDEQDCYICPNCGADIGSIDDYFPRDRYCHECGQAIQRNENLEGMEDERD